MRAASRPCGVEIPGRGERAHACDHHAVLALSAARPAGLDLRIHRDDLGQWHRASAEPCADAFLRLQRVMAPRRSPPTARPVSTETGRSLRYGFVRSGANCTVSTGGSDATFPSLADGEVYEFEMCVESWHDGTSFGRVSVTESVRAVQSTDAPQGYTFVVDPSPATTRAGPPHRGSSASTPTSGEGPPRNNVTVFTGVRPPRSTTAIPGSGCATPTRSGARG